MRAPFPYFGGKSAISGRVWELFGNCQNYVEPFAGSLSVLLNRPAPIKGPETVNDFSCLVVNAWRAIQADPEGLARLCIAPVSEVDKEAQHFALVSGESELRDLLGDPKAYDIEKAAWWIKGANEWIGGGYCDGTGPWSWTAKDGWRKRNAGTGVNRQLPHLGDAGTGVNRKLPHLGDAGKGVNRKLPHLGDAGKGQYEMRVEWLEGWLYALRDRLCNVRIACGDWSRVCGPSVTTKHAGTTALFLDPPYDGTEDVYGKSCVAVSEQVREWCKTNGSDPRLKIILAGRGTEHDSLLAEGWTKETWTGSKGYSNTDDRSSETLWMNFHANPQGGQATFL